jgi:hypothetical protein
MDEVQEDLRRQHQALQAEIKELREQMKLNQDPGRMQLIQELISVRLPLVHLSCVLLNYVRIPGTRNTNIPHSRKGYRERGDCEGHHEGYPEVGSCKGKPQREHHSFAAVRHARLAFCLF